MEHSKIYGYTFKEIRTQKNLSLSFFEPIVKKTNLIKFERGETMLSIERIDSLLQKIDVSLAEYELMLNHFTHDYKEEFLIELEEADFKHDKVKLQQLLEEADEDVFKWLFLATKSCLSALTSNECKKITEHLQSISKWGFFELSILYFVLDNLEIEDIISIMKEFEAKNKNYYNISKYRRKILQIAYRASALFTLKGYKEISLFILNRTKDRRESHDMFISNLRKLTEGYYLYKFEDKVIGEKKIELALLIFEELDETVLKNYYTERLHSFLKNNI